ncbi:MAG: DeoR family transcriptional regulator, partial [Turicibacter sp.]|nr:DeoR family transcriptional regulator [Turicibacter sp.]
KFVEKSFNDKSHQFVAQKDLIAQYAASLVDEGDSIYLDSGTTTYEMIKYLKDKEIVVVTNGLSHVESLIECNIPCFVLGGKVKQKTKAVVGYEAISALGRYRFDKCFMGSNGVHSLHGFTTPDPEEAMIKENAIKASNNVFILVDDSKFGEVSFTRFAEIGEATIITNGDDDLTQYQDKTTVKVVRK